MSSSTSTAPASRIPGTEYLGLAAVLVLLVVLFSLLSEFFFTALTFRTLANQIPSLAVICIGMTYVLVIAGIDLSVGSVLAFTGSVMGFLLVDAGWGILPGSLSALAVGLLCGLFNGFVSVRWAVPSFIVTLGMLEIARGGSYLVTNSQTKYIGAAIEPIGAPLPFIGLSPSILITILLVLAGQYVLSRTVFGRYMIAIGTNEETVRLSGVNPRPIKIAVFALAGLLAGLGGVFQIGYLQSADPNAGIGLELSAIAAVVIGGTSLMGGRGSVVASFLGVLIIAVLQAGLAQIGASEPTKRVITGAVIVAAVILDAYRHKLAGKRFGLFRRLFRRG